MTYAINTSAGTISGLKITSEMWFLTRGNNGQTVNIYGLPNITRIGQTQRTSNNGNSWTTPTTVLTPDGHLHQFTATETFYYYAQFNESGTLYNSTLYSDPLELVPLPPIMGNIYAPAEGNYSNSTLWINYTVGSSASGNAMSYYNITLHELDGTLVSVIRGNNSLNLSYNWNTSGTPQGTYRVWVEVTSNASLKGTGEGLTFLFDKTAPTTTATGHVSGITPYTFGTVANDFVSITLTCNDSVGIGCNVTTYCNSSVNSCVPNNTYSSSFDIADEGTSYIRYNSSDLLGNIESVKNSTIIIHTLAPSVISILNSTTNDSTTNITGYCYGTDAFNLTGYTWKLYKNNIVNLSGSNTSTFINGFYNKAVTVTPSSLADGQVWTMECNVSDGVFTTTVNSSDLVLIAYNSTTLTTAVENTNYVFWFNSTTNITNVNFGITNTGSYSWTPMTLASAQNYYYNQLMPVALLGATNYTYAYNFTINGIQTKIEKIVLVTPTAINTTCTSPRIKILTPTIVDEKTNVSLNSGSTIEIIFTLYFSNGVTKFTSFNVTGGTSICMDAGTSVNSTVQMLYYKNGYNQRTYYMGYLSPILFGGTWNNVTLYLLANTTGSPITFTVNKWNGEPLLDGYLIIQRFFTASNNFVDISISLTDNNGQSTVYLEPYNAFYRYLVATEGSIAYTGTSHVISYSTDTVRLTESIPNSTTNDVLQTSVIYNFNKTSRVASAVVDFNGVSRTAHMTVMKNGFINDTLQCNNSATGTSMTLLCVLPANNTDSYEVSVVGQFDNTNYTLLSQPIQDYKNSFRSDAIIAIIFLVLNLTFFFMRSPEFAIFGNLIGLWLAFGMNLLIMGTLSMGTIVGLTIAGIFVWVALRK
jgi:hypothetical protein